MQHFSDQDFIKAGLRVLEIEASSINALASNLSQSFASACRVIANCKGRVLLIGIGKSGHIARKIAATFASTGTPAFFVHPAEAAHGDLGMITEEDVVITISKSGETQEILSFMPLIKRRGIKTIALLGKVKSTIASLSDITLDVSVDKEACALNLAPTASTTVALAMGDALAVAILQARGFTEEDFAKSHPGGLLGRRLLIKISDIMQSDTNLPKVYSNTPLHATMLEMSHKRLGMTTVVDQNDPQTIIGICTDGDLRRAFSENLDLQNTQVHQIMTKNFKTIYSDLLAAEAAVMMQDHKISAVPVVDRNNKLVGALNIHNVLAAGVV